LVWAENFFSFFVLRAEEPFYGFFFFFLRILWNRFSLGHIFRGFACVLPGTFLGPFKKNKKQKKQKEEGKKEKKEKRKEAKRNEKRKKRAPRKEKRRKK
jgi:hypothetical protein